MSIFLGERNSNFIFISRDFSVWFTEQKSASQWNPHSFWWYHIADHAKQIRLMWKSIYVRIVKFVVKHGVEILCHRPLVFTLCVENGNFNHSIYTLWAFCLKYISAIFFPHNDTEWTTQGDRCSKIETEKNEYIFQRWSICERRKTWLKKCRISIQSYNYHFEATHFTWVLTTQTNFTVPLVWFMHPEAWN